MVICADANEGKLDSIETAIATAMAPNLAFMMVETHVRMDILINSNERMKTFFRNTNVGQRER